MNTIVSRFANDESGATAIEYGLIAGILSVGIIAALQSLRGTMQTQYGAIDTAMN